LSLAVLLASASSVVSSASASKPHVGKVAIPRVVGDDLQTAYDRLHDAGLRVSIPAGIQLNTSGFSTLLAVKISPRPGHRVARDSTVTLTLGCPTCGLGSPAVPIHMPKYRVPEFVGHRASAASAWVNGKTLYFAVHLGPLIGGNAHHLYGNYEVTRQEPTAGTLLTLGQGTSSPGGSSGTFLPTPLTVWGTQARPPTS
jgi:hypothetical protein